MNRVLLLVAVSAVASSCLVPSGEDAGGGPSGGGEGGGGGGGAVTFDAGVDAGVDGGVDAGLRDAGVDAGWDAGEPDAGEFDAGEPDSGTPLDAGTPGESCANPIVLAPPVVDGGFSVTMRVEPFSNNTSASCSTDAGLEAVFQFELTGPSQDITVSVSPPQGGATANVSIHEAPCGTGVELGCGQRASTQAGQLLRIPARPAGTYFMTVELEEGSWVDVTLSAAVPLPPPPNDTCATATQLNFVNGQASVFSYTHGASNDAAPATCYLGVGPRQDVVYTYTLTQPQDVAIDFVILAGSPALYVRRDCQNPSASNELSCSGFRDRKFLNQQPGTYYIWFDGDEAQAQITVTLAPPTLPPSNDRCAAGVRLFEDGGMRDVVSGTTRGGDPSLGLWCNLGPTPDVFYSFSVASPQRLEAMVRPLAWDGGSLMPAIGLVRASSCPVNAGPDAGQWDAGANLLGCVRGWVRAQGTRLTVSQLDPGDYQLAVQGTESEGPFVLEAELQPVAAPAANDSCATVQSLALDANGRAEARGSTRGLADDHLGSVCRPLTGSPDVVYSFTTPAIASSDAGFNAYVDVLSENAAEYMPTVFVNLFCEAGYTSQNACGMGQAWRARAQALARGLSPSTTYHFYVEGDGASVASGPFSLTLDVADQPSNDRCETATPITLNTSLAGSLVGASRDYQTSFHYAGCTTHTGLHGPDVVYAFTAPSSGVFQAQLVARPGLEIFVSVIDGLCDGTGDCIAQSQPDVVRAQTVTFNAVAGRTYFLVVDSQDFSAGNIASIGGIGSFVIGVSQ